jgi:mono/diheme cytochrome c family protein
VSIVLGIFPRVDGSARRWPDILRGTHVARQTTMTTRHAFPITPAARRMTAFGASAAIAAFTLLLWASAAPTAHAVGAQAATAGDRDLGATLFTTYCAVCHGKDARGGGIVTSALRHTPPDLTRYTARNGGVFPRDRVYRIIDGRDVATHGDRDMPIWGDAFSKSRKGLSDAEVKARIDAIVGYLEAIQVRAAE